MSKPIPLLDKIGEEGRVWNDLREEYGVEAIYEPVNVHTARWVDSEDVKTLEAFRMKAEDNLALDGGGHLTYLAPTRVNLSLSEERHPDIRFRATREH